MMPSVTVPPNSPNGLPTARVNSPTCRLSESPTTAGVRPVASIFSTAISVLESAPTTVAGYSVPSLVRTVTWLAPLTTWLFVMM